MLRPSGHVGGDLVGSFQIDETRLAVYSVDVSGHGVASAMMTARLAGLLSGGTPDQNIAMRTMADGSRQAWPPDQVAARLNRMMLEDMQVDQYLTMVYAEINLATGEGQLVQAGHPFPVILRRDGATEPVGEGGMPIGLIDFAEYSLTPFRLAPGDRLALVSDGITECPGRDGSDFGLEGICSFLSENSHMNSAALLESVIWTLAAFLGADDFPMTYRP